MNEKFPINEDFYLGEDPKNLPQLEPFDKKNDFAEPLPDKYLNNLPEYFKIFCKPYISKDGQIKFNIELNNEFLSAIKIHYNLKNNPNRQELCSILESELKSCLKNF